MFKSNIFVVIGSVLLFVGLLGLAFTFYSWFLILFGGVCFIGAYFYANVDQEMGDAIRISNIPEAPVSKVYETEGYEPIEED